MRYLIITVLTILLGSNTVMAQKDTSHYLLSDIDMQIEATDALNLMYDFKFEQANEGFNAIRRKYPNHPLAYFLKGLAEFWKIKPNDTNKSYDEHFFALMDSSIYFAEKMHDKNKNNMEARFFLSAAYGFKGRLYSDRESKTKAIFAAKSSLKYMPDKDDEPTEYSPEFLFGEGLSNYYKVWISENIPFFKPIIAMFAGGNKELGIQQLTDVANNAFYTRVEAQTYLVEILTNYENQPYKAYPYAKYLAETYPNNPYLERYFARVAYSSGRVKDCETASLSVLNKVNQKVPFYDAASGRYAAFFLGYYQRTTYGNRAKAKEYYALAATYSEELKMFGGYYLHSMTFLAQLYDEEKNVEMAKNCYLKVKKYAEHDSENYKEAKAWLEKH